MDIQQLRYFEVAARHENITKAAQELYMSQPNLSTALKRLEESLGMALFERRKGRVSLTPCGRVYLESVERALDILKKGEQSARSIYEAGRRRIRLAAPLPDLVAKVLEQFLAKHPDMSIRQFNFTNEECLSALEKETADIAVVFGPVHHRDVEFIPVSASERVIVVGPDHRFFGRDFISVTELAGEHCICNVSRDDGRFFEDIQMQYGVEIKTVCECDNDEVEMNLLSAGVGIAVSPLMNFIKHAEKERGKFPAAMVRIREPLEQVQLGYAFRTGYKLPPETQELCDELRDVFAGESTLADKFLIAQGYEI